MTSRDAAKSLHSMLSAFKVSIGESPYKSWEEIPEHRQKFFIGAIRYVHLLSLSDHVYYHELMCEEIHKYWMRWSKIHDPSHTSLIPYSELSDTEKMKDGFVVNIITAMLPYISDMEELLKNWSDK